MPKGSESRQSHQNRVQSKHVDFVICDRATIRPLVAVELDDSSHARIGAGVPDEFVDAALTAATLPLVRVLAQAELQRPGSCETDSDRNQLTGLHFGVAGCRVSTVGLDEIRVRQCIHEQEQQDERQGKLDLE